MNNYVPPKPSWMSDADYREHERRVRRDENYLPWRDQDDIGADWDDPPAEERGRAEPFFNGVPKGAATRIITFAPYVWRAPETLPMRRWLYGKHYIRKYISATIGAGGRGKSSLDLVEAVAMTTGINLVGVPVPGRLRVAYWGEDPVDEIDRRVGAILKHF
jgi:hypothetical protein